MKKPLILLLFALVITTTASGQVVCPPGSDPCIPTGPGLPIDSGISFLIIAGAAYGYKKLKSKK